MADIKKLIGGGLVATLCIGILALLSGKQPEQYSRKWIESLSDEDWSSEREKVRKMYGSPEYDDTTRMRFRDILDLFDRVKSDRDWAGKEPGFPVHSEHGWYLPGD